MPASDWTPLVADVGAQLRARTRLKSGAEAGTFTDETRPTEAQAASMVSRGVGDVAMVIGNDIPQMLWDDAKDVAVIAAAMRIELSYFPEQIATGKSPYRELKELYDSRIKELKVAVQNVEAGGSADPGAPLKPVFNFDVTEGDPYIIGRRTAL